MVHLTWDEHLVYFHDALAKYDRGSFDESVASWNVAIERRPSSHARWNRAQARLSLGDYGAFREDYPSRWSLFPGLLTDRGMAIRARLPAWRGETITGKRLVLLHEQGFGDTIMLLRYVRQLFAMGIEVVLSVPPPLQRLASQVAPLSETGDLCCPMFDLMVNLKQTPATVPHASYLTVDPLLRRQWAERLPVNGRRRIGITWTQGRWHTRDFQRSLPLDLFLQLLAAPDANVFSLQQQGRDEARARGVIAFEFTDFADVAALGALMDVVVSIDTAAVHAVAATGYGKAIVVLPYLSSWRWLGSNVWYPQVRRAQQTSPGDWASAFREIKQCH